MKKKIGKWLSIGLPLILGIYLIYYKYNEFTTEQIHEIKGYFKNANYFYIYLSLVIALFGFISRAYRWKYAIQHLGYQTHFYNNLMAVCVGYFMNLTIPRSGEFSRALVLKNYENMPFDKAFGTIVAERVVDTLIFLLFVFASLLFQFNVLKNYVLTKIPVENLIILVSIGFVGFVLLLLLWIYSNWKIVSAIKEKLSGLIEGMSSILKMEQKWKFLFHSFFIWFTYILMFYVTIFALKETSNISFGAVIIAFVFGTLAVGFTNSGFGVYPLLIAEIFMLYGVPDTAGTAFGWLTWASQTILMIVLGGLSFLFLPILNRK
ncbi:lysylphosphatidylglycerol synthase transmembrane domain-containing protein [Flavobacterium psychrophilum]|uniref:lysylphosphatidylglycerol synthase transmembrane domain-containing protein n=1 Tax=Flavobacterium psychrophilum TaxID=96345 RepID=UPI000B7C2645|nr:lysylphosphatidylglycerol synthase transmembrane domain-containing protein [Flavobacterium psychrophilum]MBF2023573.1 flippase-like domain-containing protein [Flavobacterium psychrophilum]MCB5982975.1 flippase-like domain-containing protein [Flavobacterium psychrophilum]MCB5994158.1 flippase-like domain-containing protein [Flavobacterium psychrophilum]MCB5997090.1 flippase-like domain-containing protein [Flavobacterium psychrophilum]MCB6004436.1 flippase-like domain-containing protein [Flav